MKLNHITNISLIVLIIMLNSCGMVYRSILGIDITPKWKTINEIKKDFDKRKIPNNQRFVLDTASYSNLVNLEMNKRIEELKSDSANYDSLEIERIYENAKNDLQPVQVRYFSNNGEAFFKMINCYVQPLIPMTWNVEGCFDIFPPKTISYLENDENKNLEFFLPHIKTLDGDSIKLKSLPKADYYAIVFWNSFMIKPSNKLISVLNKYDEKNLNQNTYFLFVNNHNAEIWSYCNNQQKADIVMELKE